MIKKINFEIETITPIFLSGADQSKAELRAASIKGLLRYWWRTLQAESDLDTLREREGKIFGSADEEKGGGSSFSIRTAYNGDLNKTTADLPKHNITVTSKSKGKTFSVNILEYLAYGPCSYDKNKRRNVIVREYIQHGFKFNMHMHFFREGYLNEILKTIYVFSLFGGLGSKSRNGFGSFNILNKEEAFRLLEGEFSIDAPYTKTNLQKIIKQSNNKSYTAFVGGTRVFRTKELYSTWDQALAETGKIYRGIRSGDFKIKNTGGKQIMFENHFKYDKRQYIGSPIIVDKQEKSFLDRHAKPYFIKIAKEGNKYRAYILYLPSLYCIGLEKDRNNRSINHNAEDMEFNRVCEEFNTFLALAEQMEPII